MSESVRVITTASHQYAGRWYRTGETLVVSAADAADLVAARFAVIAPEEPTDGKDQDKDKRRYKRRDMEPEK